MTDVVTFAEYLRLERPSPTKHDLRDGKIIARDPGTPEHARLASKVGYIIGRRIDGRGCEVFSSDLRLRVLATGLATYPDLTVICGRIETDPEDRDTVVNPVVLVEVLSWILGGRHLNGSGLTGGLGYALSSRRSSQRANLPETLSPA